MASNPLAGVWDLEIDTIITMGQKLADIEASVSPRKLPIIHFGFIQLDEHLGYVAGGLSRVYFGKIKKTPVAVKILFAMELTPQVVSSFYDEIQILYSLQHPNIITCLGVSVMPPAVCVILEYCQYGSLFDFLHKPVMLSEGEEDVAISTRIGRSSDTPVTEMSNFSTRFAADQPAHDLEGGSTAPKRASRTISAEDFATAPKRGSRTLDELLAKKRGSRKDELLVAKMSHGSDAVAGSEIPNPLHRLPTPQHGHGHGADSSWLDNEANSYQRSILERASSVVDSIFGRTPTDRPSMALDTERFSTSQNDRLKGLVGGDARTQPHGAGASGDQARQSGTQSHSLYSLPSLTGIQTKSLFAVKKPKTKGSGETRQISLEEKFEMIVGACRGLSFLHERGYMHCDLKSPNFLVSNVRPPSSPPLLLSV
jgi:hypothetical protein